MAPCSGTPVYHSLVPPPSLSTRTRPGHERLARVIDVTMAAGLLIVLAPLMGAAAAVIRLSGRGPVLYHQVRFGLGGEPFTMLKFRTMRVGSDRSGSVTVHNDRRIISGGRFLRATKIDELPQLVNILRGDMAFVGPRPMVADDRVRLDERQLGRERVRPGLSGLAQVNGNTSLSWPERIEFDLEYVDRRSVALDLRIMLDTARLIVSGRAATDPPTADEWSNA